MCWSFPYTCIMLSKNILKKLLKKQCRITSHLPELIQLPITLAGELVGIWDRIKYTKPPALTSFLILQGFWYNVDAQLDLSKRTDARWCHSTSLKTAFFPKNCPCFLALLSRETESHSSKFWSESNHSQRSMSEQQLTHKKGMNIPQYLLYQVVHSPRWYTKKCRLTENIHSYLCDHPLKTILCLLKIFKLIFL